VHIIDGVDVRLSRGREDDAGEKEEIERGMDELLCLPHESQGSRNGARVLLWYRREGDVGEEAGEEVVGPEGLGFQMEAKGQLLWAKSTM
jgi:hypothetical protein